MSVPVFSPKLLISHLAGFYGQEIQVLVSSEESGALLRFTTDGSPPTMESPEVPEKIAIRSTTVLKSRAFVAGKIPSPVVTGTYLIGETVQLPVISLSADPDNIFDQQIGIYSYGNTYEKTYPYRGANFWKDY